MNLWRLLNAGKSLAGSNETKGRYRMGDPRALPTFGTEKNPFRVKATTGTPPQDKLPVSSQPEPQPEELKKEKPLSAPTVSTQKVPEAKPEVVKPIAPPQAKPAKAARSSQKPDALMGSAKPVRKGARALAAEWIARLNPLASFGAARRSRGAARQAIGESKQGELSLDQVLVVRNDLSDCDLEVVAVRSMRGRPGGASKASAGVICEPADAAGSSEAKTTRQEALPPMPEKDLGPAEDQAQQLRA
jgi:hypothetical protein